MGLGDEGFDFCFVVMEERVDVLDVDELCALRLWEDEVEEDRETNPRVEGDPGEPRAVVSALVRRLSRYAE
jgi:hypothetical protein